MYGNFFKVILLLLSFKACAIEDWTSYLNHAYGGVGIGGVIGQFTTTSNTTVSPSSSFFYNQMSSPQLANTNVLGALFIGKVYPIKQLWIGPEITLNIGAPTSLWTEYASLLFPEESLITTTKSYLNVVSGGFDARIGIPMRNENVLYGRLGVAVNQLSNTITNIDARPLIGLEVGKANVYAQTLAGLRVGLGFEQHINNNWSLRGDYVFTYYPGVSLNSVNVPINASAFQLGPISNATQVQVNTQALLVELVYHWCATHDK